MLVMNLVLSIVKCKNDFEFLESSCLVREDETSNFGKPYVFGNLAAPRSFFLDNWDHDDAREIQRFAEISFATVTEMITSTERGRVA